MPEPETPSEAPAPPAAAPPAPAVEPAAPAPPPAEDWETRFKYLFADFENFRKRSSRDREQALAAGRAQVLRELLPLWEAFERAREAAEALPPKDPLRAGLELLGKDWERFFREAHVAPVARVGEAFRPDEHEAVAETPASREARDGAVAEIVQQGYRSDGGLLRPAKVVVARRAPPVAGRPPAASTEEGRP